MQIKQFDTGLKDQKNIKNLDITPEENLKNKQKVRSYLNRIYQTGKSKIDENVKNYFSEDDYSYRIGLYTINLYDNIN